MSVGYQRAFADERGRILLHARDGALSKPVSVVDAFVETDFNTARPGNEPVRVLEDEWARVEGVVLPQVRAIVERSETPTGRDSVRVLAALHFARSYSFDVLFGRLVAAGYGEFVDELLEDDEMRRAWEQGRDEGLDREQLTPLVAERFNELLSDGVFRAQRMISIYNQAIEKLRALHVQIVRHPSHAPVPSVPFITGDTPVVAWEGVRTGHRDGIGLRAEAIWFPLSPNTGAMFTTDDEGDANMPSTVDAQRFNRRVLRASWRFVGAHPATDIRRALAV